MRSLMLPRGILATMLVVAGLLSVAPTAGAQFGRTPQYDRPTTKAERQRRARAAIAAMRPGDPGVTAHETIAEVEPNDTTTVATRAAIGDMVTGLVNPAFDEDWFSLDIPSGTRVVFDIDAQALGSPFDAVLILVAPDGRTVLAFNDDFEGLDSRITFTVPTTGRYFIGVADFDGRGAPNFRYALRMTSSPAGPGDATTLVATQLGVPYALAAAPGVLWVADRASPLDSRILRVTNTGIVSTLVQGPAIGVPYGIAVDGFGDLLVAGGDSAARGQVLRVSPTGQVSMFRTGVGYSVAIAVGPDGDVWVGDDSALVIRRFDPTGVPKGTTSVAAAQSVRHMAFSPAGELHFSNGFDGVFRLTTGGAVRVLTRPQYLEGLAFDAAGRLYVANGFLGTVSLFSATYQPIAEPFASSNIGGPTALAFLRDASGAMTSRLVASNVGYNLQPPYVGSLVEMRSGSTPAPGFRVGTDLLRIANATLRSGVVGAELRDTLRLESGATATWTITEGALPPGVTLSTNGVLSGIPERKGTFEVSVRGTTSTSLGARRLTLVVDDPALDVTAATAHLLGAAGTLTPALERFLDLQGNRNGRADIGDLRAYLRSRGMLPASNATTVRTGGTTP